MTTCVITAACPQCHREFSIEFEKGTPASKLYSRCDHCGVRKRVSAFQEEYIRTSNIRLKAALAEKQTEEANRVQHQSTSDRRRSVDEQALYTLWKQHRAKKNASVIAAVLVVTLGLVYLANPKDKNLGLSRTVDNTSEHALYGTSTENQDPTFQQWKDILSTCHPDPDYILTSDDVYKCMGIYRSGIETPTFAAHKKRLFNIIAGCYYWNREETLEEWTYMFIQKWDTYWDDSPHCELAESSRESEIERRRENAQYTRKSTRTPPATGVKTRQEVANVCKNSTARTDIEFEITVAVDYRTDLRGGLRSRAEVKEMRCEQVCDFVPGDPDRCCECESAIVDFVFHQHGWD